MKKQFSARTILSLTLLSQLLLPMAASAEDRVLGLLVNQTPKLDYGTSFTIAKDAGMQSITMSLAWDELEPKPGQYDDKMLKIANSFYPPQNTKVTLVIPTIDTVNLRLPKDLKGRKFDDPEVIARFKKLLAFTFQQIPAVQLTCLSIGNEVDGYLNKDAGKWRDYLNFFQATSAYARGLRPGLRVGCKTGYGGTVFKNIEEVRKLNTYCDALMLTYYPLEMDAFRAQGPDTVYRDLSRVVSLYPQKPIYILETGYPSSTAIKGSPQDQALFVHNFFTAWDAFSKHIKIVEFLWLNDMTEQELDYMAKYYGSSASDMRNFLGSLGFREANGRAKPALATFKKEALSRKL
jgi:hypothetical protein